jgi:hypothetical protein
VDILEWQLRHADPLNAEELLRTVAVHTDARNAVADALAALRRATPSL